MTSADDKKLMTPTEVAAEFRVDPRTVSRWARMGRIGSVKTPGGHTRLYRAEIMALLDGGIDYWGD